MANFMQQRRKRTSSRRGRRLRAVPVTWSLPTMMVGSSQKGSPGRVGAAKPLGPREHFSADDGPELAIQLGAVVLFDDLRAPHRIGPQPVQVEATVLRVEDEVSGIASIRPPPDRVGCEGSYVADSCGPESVGAMLRAGRDAGGPRGRTPPRRDAGARLRSGGARGPAAAWPGTARPPRQSGKCAEAISGLLLGSPAIISSTVRQNSTTRGASSVTGKPWRATMMPLLTTHPFWPRPAQP